MRTKNIQNKPAVNQAVNAVAGPPILPPPIAGVPSGRPSLAPVTSLPAPSRLQAPRPSRVPRPSGIETLGARNSSPLTTGPEIILKAEEKPPVLPVHLTEEEINARV